MDKTCCEVRPRLKRIFLEAQTAHFCAQASIVADVSQTLRQPTLASQVEVVAHGGSETAKTRRFYGWVILPLAMLAMFATSPGQTFGVSIFNEPIRESLNLTHGQLSAAYTIGTLLGAVPLMFVGAALDRYGLRRTMLGVLSVFCLACGLTSMTNSWLMLTAMFFLLRMLGPGAMALLSGSMLPFWFNHRLGLVEGLRSVGYACSMAIVPSLNLYLVSEFGWRGSYAIFGAGIWVCLFPLYYFLLRNSPAEVGQQIDGLVVQSKRENATLNSQESIRIAFSGSEQDEPLLRGNTHFMGSTVGLGCAEFSVTEALKTYSFWVASIGTAVFGLVMTAVFFCLVPIFEERGLSQQDAAEALFAYAISLAITQLLGGAIADRLPAPPLLTLGLIGLSLGLSLLQAADHRTWATLASLLLGASLGFYSGAVQPLWARYYGRHHLGKIRGVLTTMNIALSGVGPLVAGMVRDSQGSFDMAMWLFISLPLPLAALSWFAKPPRKPAQTWNAN